MSWTPDHPDTYEPAVAWLEDVAAALTDAPPGPARRLLALLAATEANIAEPPVARPLRAAVAVEFRCGRKRLVVVWRVAEKFARFRATFDAREIRTGRLDCPEDIRERMAWVYGSDTYRLCDAERVATGEA